MQWYCYSQTGEIPLPLKISQRFPCTGKATTILMIGSYSEPNQNYTIHIEPLHWFIQWTTFLSNMLRIWSPCFKPDLVQLEMAAWFQQWIKKGGSSKKKRSIHNIAFISPFLFFVNRSVDRGNLLRYLIFMMFRSVNSTVSAEIIICNQQPLWMYSKWTVFYQDTHHDLQVCFRYPMNDWLTEESEILVHS